MDGTTVVWFRKDLRIEDNPAMVAAIRRKCSVIPVFIQDENGEGPAFPGGASRWWLHHALTDLAKELKALGSRLILRKGSSLECLKSLVNESKADHVYWNRRYEPSIVERDKRIKADLKQNGIAAKSFNASLLFEPHEIQNKAGKPFQVFTRYWEHCRQRPISAPEQASLKTLKTPRTWPASERLEDWSLLPEIPWDAEFSCRWKPNRSGAIEFLDRFTEAKARSYSEKRNRPDLDGTSSLSPYLHFGQIGPREIYAKIADAKLLNLENPQVFLTEIGWREFSHHLLYHFPDTPELPLRSKFQEFPWRRNKSFLKAWQKGETGYPIVDAGMRQLWETGWMHNRVRMITASFLVKHLLQPWQDGAAWFWDTLVDADLANNTQGWQWTAGCGADASPYFRIFNPITQGQKFDPNGSYTKRWVPELKELSLKHLFSPWTADTSTLEAAKIALGKSYPMPIVDHAEAREKALAAFRSLK